MNSFLIIGGNQQERIKKAQKLVGFWQPHPDLLLIEPDLSIGIKQIREAQKFLSRRPYQEKIKAVVIPEAEKITIPAQNAFLKTLEEPPGNSLIILCSPNQDDLLPTIISRCQLIKLAPKSEIDIDQKLITHYSLLITDLLKSSAGQRLQLIEPYTKSREDAIQFCQEMIITLRHQMKNKTNKDLSLITDHLSLLIKSLSLLQANVNAKLVLENLVLKLPFSG